MSRSGYLQRFTAGLCLAFFSITPAGCQHKQDFVTTAQAVYYNLPKQGVTEMECSVTPDWEAFLSHELKTEFKPDNSALKLLNGVHFWVSVNEAGKVKLTHQVDASPASMSDLDNFQKAISGVEEMLDGFWKTASLFLFTSPLPKPGVAYQVSQHEGNYLISYREGQYDVVTTLTKDYAISEMKVSSATLNSSTKPSFEKTERGLLLTAFDTEFKVASDRPAHISIQVKYQAVDGLHLPSYLTIQTSSDAGSPEWHLHLKDYKIRRH